MVGALVGGLSRARSTYIVSGSPATSRAAGRCASLGVPAALADGFQESFASGGHITCPAVSEEVQVIGLATPVAGRSALHRPPGGNQRTAATQRTPQPGPVGTG